MAQLIRYYRPMEEHYVVQFSGSDAMTLSTACEFHRRRVEQLPKDAFDIWDCGASTAAAYTIAGRELTIPAGAWNAILSTLDNMPGDRDPDARRLANSLRDQVGALIINPPPR